MTSKDLLPYTATPQARADVWASLGDEALRRRVMKAVGERDAEALWAMTEAYLVINGGKGSKVSANTLRTYRRGVLDLLEAWAGENLLAPSRDAGPQWRNRLQNAYKPGTVQVKLAAAKVFYDALRWAGATTATPFYRVKAPADSIDPAKKREAYAKSEIEALLDRATLPDKIVILLGAHAGLRISEVSRLRWEDLDWTGRRIRIAGGKGGKTAWTRGSRRLFAELRELWLEAKAQERPWVLPFRGDRARQRLRRLCGLAGIEYKGKEVHGLRHSAGTRYYRQTQDPYRTADFLRHASVQTTRRYAKTSEEHIGKDVEDW